MKYLFKSILLFSLILLISGCSSLSVALDYDRSIDFSNFRNYQWKDGIDINWKKGESTLIYDRNIVHLAVNSILSPKGYVILLSGKPDFYIYPHTNPKDIISVSEWGYRYSSMWAPGTKKIDSDFYKGNNLFIDIVDAKRKVLIWRGAATELNPDKLTKEEIEKTVQKAVLELFKNFPPDAKKK